MSWSEWVLAAVGAAVLLCVSAVAVGWALNELGKWFGFLWDVVEWVYAGKPRPKKKEVTNDD